jgi:heptosyltransferase-2
VLTGSLQEAELTSKIAAGIGDGCIDLGGKTALSVLSAVIRQCALFISNDTGVMHAAYAAGTPTVAIFSGRFHPHIWYPYGDRQIVVRRPIACELCGHDICPLYDYPKCLAIVTPDEVVEAAAKMLDASQMCQVESDESSAC